MNRCDFARRIGLPIFVVGTLAASSLASNNLTGPTELDPGLVEQVTWSSQSSFLNIYQVSLSADFGTSFTSPAMPGSLQGGWFRSSLQFRMPWQLGVPTVFFRSISLDLGSGDVTVSSPLSVDVAQGNRIYHSTTPDGMFVMEMEAEEPVSQWSEESNQAGFTDLGYHVWRGSDHFSDKNAGRKQFRIQVDNPGVYQLALRSWHRGGSDNNDVWMKIDNGSWTKIYAWASESGQWSWTCFTDPGHVRFTFNLSRGNHTVHFAARSRNFFIDRFHLFHTGFYSRQQAENPNLAPSDHTYP